METGTFNIQIVFHYKVNTSSGVVFKQKTLVFFSSDMLTKAEAEHAKIGFLDSNRDTLDINTLRSIEFVWKPDQERIG